MSTIRSTSTPSTAKTAQPAQTAKQTQTTQTASSASKPSCERVAQRAYEKWLKRGCVHGHDLQDWVDAEKELMAEQGRSTTASASSTGARR